MDRATNLNECYLDFAAYCDEDGIEQIRQTVDTKVITLKYGLVSYFDLENSSSQLVKFFKEHSIVEADEMAETIAYGFWLHLNSKPCEIDDIKKLRHQLQGKTQDLPKNLNDCYSALSVELSEDDVDDIKMTHQNELIPKYHFGLGGFIRQNFGLWGESPLSSYFFSQQVNQPDEMSAIILHGFWLFLNSEPCDFESAKRAANHRY